MDVLDAVAGWTGRTGPMYRRLASAMADAIARGDLVVGQGLPAERALAAQLAVARSTVVAAYDQLRERGLVDSRQGSGTWVAGGERRGQAAGGQRESLRAAAYREGPDVIDLATASLPADESVRQALAAVAARPDDGVLEGAGYYRLGLPRLREAIAQHYREAGVPTTPDEVLVTTGDQQAISLLAEHFLGAGDVAVVEEPTPPGALDVLRSLPITVRTVPAVTGPEGIDPLLGLVRRGGVRLVYVNPTLGLTGRVLPDLERRRLLRELAGHDVVLVGDESLRHLTFDDPPVPLHSVAGRSGSATVVSIGSLSKLFWGGLRVGWIRASEPVVGRLARTKARADLGTPVVSQMIAARLLDQYPEVRERRVAWLSEALDRSLAQLAVRLPDFEVTRPEGGLSLWVRLPSGLAEPFAALAARVGVTVVPGTLLSVLGAADDRIRVVFARDEPEFAEGVSRLAEAWSLFTARPDDSLGGLQGPVLV